MDGGGVGEWAWVNAAAAPSAARDRPTCPAQPLPVHHHMGHMDWLLHRFPQSAIPIKASSINFSPASS